MSKDARFTEGILNLTDAGRYLRVPQQTFHRWARGYQRGEALLHARPIDDLLPVTFITLAEGHVLDALRQAGVRPHKIRPGLEALKRDFGEYALVAPELATDGVDILWDYSKSAEGHDLMVPETRQQVFREIVQDYMSYVAYDDDPQFPRSLELRFLQPSKVIVDIRRSFGQPIFAASGARVADVAGMLKAGEDAETVADEFGIDVTDARTAARILLGRAA
jgi:uncharacterized protein (DUF433 family)